jgi:hypothetical protein
VPKISLPLIVTAPAARFPNPGDRAGAVVVEDYDAVEQHAGGDGREALSAGAPVHAEEVEAAGCGAHGPVEDRVEEEVGAVEPHFRRDGVQVRVLGPQVRRDEVPHPVRDQPGPGGARRTGDDADQEQRHPGHPGHPAGGRDPFANGHVNLPPPSGGK